VAEAGCLQEASSGLVDRIANLDACSQCFAALGGLRASRTVFLDVVFEPNGQGIICQARRCCWIISSVRAQMLPIAPAAQPGPEAQTRMVSAGDFWPSQQELSRISNTWLTHGFLSSSPICPARQSVSNAHLSGLWLTRLHNDRPTVHQATKFRALIPHNFTTGDSYREPCHEHICSMPSFERDLRGTGESTARS
jgi:hypothetical protein